MTARKKQAKRKQDSSWRRWFLEKLAVPVMVAVTTAGGGIAGAEIQSRSHHCEPAKITTHTVTRTANGKVTTTDTTQQTSCPKR